MTTSNRRNGKRRLLVPLATLLAAAAVAVGSGATYTSTSAHAVSVTSGVLTHSNNHDGETLAVTNFRPGDTASGTLTITNDGTIDSTLILQETSSTNGFTSGVLTLKISQGATVLYNDDFGGLADATKLNLGDLPVGASTTVTYTISMDAAAGNENQGAVATAHYQWVTTQKSSPASVTQWIAGLV